MPAIPNVQNLCGDEQCQAIDKDADVESQEFVPESMHEDVDAKTERNGQKRKSNFAEGKDRREGKRQTHGSDVVFDHIMSIYVGKVFQAGGVDDPDAG